MVLPLDMPDDYPWLPGSGKSTLGDLGELAARMGSIVTYDRRGSVYWLDDFESGLSPWLTGGAGTGWEVRIVDTPTFRGGFSCRLTAGSSGGTNAVVNKRLAPALLSTYGLEVTFSFESDVDHLLVTFQYNTGLIKKFFQVKISVADQALYYFSDSSNFVLIKNVIIPDTDKYLFSTVKLVVDIENNKQLRVLFNQTEYDLSGINGYAASDTSDPKIEASITLLGTGGSNAIAYVDSVIVTVGDP